MSHAFQKTCGSLVWPTAAIHTLCVHYAMHFRNKVTMDIVGEIPQNLEEIFKENHWLYTTRVYTNSMVGKRFHD